MGVGIVFLIISGLLFIAFAVMLFVSLEFQRRSKNTAGVIGVMTDWRHDKNVRGRRRTYKDVTRATYTYLVNGKEYQRRCSRYVTPKNSPFKVTIVYFKPFPRFSYILDDIGDIGIARYFAYAFAMLAINVMYLICGIKILGYYI